MPSLVRSAHPSLIYSDTIRQDKAAVIAYLRLKHKDPFKGYILCVVVSCSRCLFTLSQTVDWASVTYCRP